jgi:hypothetical protein
MGDVDWIDCVQDRDKSTDIENRVVNPQGSIKCGEIRDLLRNC